MSDKVSSTQAQVEGWFHGVYAIDSVADALKNRHELAAHESIVTRDGCWIGTNWALFGQDQTQGGVLQREAKIEKLTDSVDLATHDLQKIQIQSENVQATIKELESEREQSRSEFRNKSHQRTDLHNRLGRIEARLSLIHI